MWHFQFVKHDVWDRDLPTAPTLVTVQRAGKSGTGHVYLFTLNKKYDIDGNVPHNKARLINHSCDPNCEVQIIKGRTKGDVAALLLGEQRVTR